MTPKEPRKLTVEMWARERLDNCHAIAATRAGKDRDGWLEDAAYWSDIIDRLAASDRILRERDELKEWLRRIANMDDRLPPCAFIEKAKEALSTLSTEAGDV